MSCLLLLILSIQKPQTIPLAIATCISHDSYAFSPMHTLLIAHWSIYLFIYIFFINLLVLEKGDPITICLIVTREARKVILFKKNQIQFFQIIYLKRNLLITWVLVYPFKFSFHMISRIYGWINPFKF
jgi:hypothetical protein